MKRISGNIRAINGCKYGNTLSIEIETSDEISLTELIGRDVEVCLLEEASAEKTAEEINQELTGDSLSESSEGKDAEKCGNCGHRRDWHFDSRTNGYGCNIPNCDCDCKEFVNCEVGE